MKQIIAMLWKRVPKEVSNRVPRPVGRWKRETCDTKMGTKIDHANEDHCGPCGQYKIDTVVVVVGEKKEDVVVVVGKEVGK